MQVAVDKYYKTYWEFLALIKHKTVALDKTGHWEKPSVQK